jgi:hypothetical protein
MTNLTASMTELPPIPSPSDDLDLIQLLDVLIAWHGGPAGAAMALVVSLDAFLQMRGSDEGYKALQPRLAELEEWAGSQATDEDELEQRVDAAAERYGYRS